MPPPQSPPILARCPSPDQGDLALPCFALRGLLSNLDPASLNNPAAIARELQKNLPPDDLLESTSAAGPYLNLKINTQTLIKTVISDVFHSGSQFGLGQPQKPEHILVEFSSPNTNKPQHLGHVRNNLLGEAVSRCIAHTGHKVTKVNLINDRGIHICKSMLAYQRWGNGATPESANQKGDHLIGAFYVLFETKFQEEYTAWKQTPDAQERLTAWLTSDDGRKAQIAFEKFQKAKAAFDLLPQDTEKKPKPPKDVPPPEKVFFSNFQDTYFNSISEIGRASSKMLVDWEAGDTETIRLWKLLNSWVISGFNQTYNRLGVSFDHLYFESETYKLGKDIITEGLKTEIFQIRADGAVTFDLTKLNLTGEKVFLRSNGTSVYMTQDLGTAISRHDQYNFNRMIYVVGNEQEYHFKVLFGVLGFVRPALKGACHHLSYGMVNLPHGKMKSREGTVVDADNLLDEMRDLALVEIKEKLSSEHYANVDETEQNRRAEVIGQAALKYFLLDVTPASDMLFDPSKSLDFKGRTGAYCIFNYARTQSVLRKAGGVPELNTQNLAALTKLGTTEERFAISMLMGWPAAVAWAGRDSDPAKVTEYLFDLCKSIAIILTDKTGHQILKCEDPQLRTARLLMVAAVGHVLKLGLTLLNIETLDEM